MFKYKYTPIIFVAFFIIIIIVYFLSSKEVQKKNDLLNNNVRFSGIITKLNVSRNHAFGILQLKIIETNNNLFKSSLGDIIYPYAIKGSVAEIYHYIPLEIKEGYKVLLNSNNKTISFYDGNKFLYQSDINIITEEIDVEFVKKHSIFE